MSSSAAAGKYQSTSESPEPINLTEKWVPEPLRLPDGADVFTDIRGMANDIFDLGRQDDWLNQELEQHVVETGEMHMSRNVEEVAARKEEEDEERIERWNEETADLIDVSRDEVSSFQEDLRNENTDVEARLREEEVAARDRLVYEHQGLEAELLRKLRSKAGSLLTVPIDKFSWSVDWEMAPQEFRLNITSLRGARAKLRDGYYVFHAMVVDRVGGKILRFSTGKDNLDCSGSLPPIRILENSATVDRYINMNVDIVCPAPKALMSYACLVVEVWKLRVGTYDRTDKVVGWGVWPLVNRDFRVIEGHFKLPLLKGPVDNTIDTYEHMAHSLQSDLKYWLGNLYFEISCKQTDSNILRSKYDELDGTQNAMLPDVITHPQQKQDKLRLAKTVSDHRRLIVPKLPPRLFFDDVALNNTGSQGLRRRYFGSDDLRPLNAALWEKRSLLEDERAALAAELSQSKRHSDDNPEEVDRMVREELMKSKNHTVGNIYKRYPEVNFSRDDEATGVSNKDKICDSHIVLLDHHHAVASQREFFFLGRRYRDRLRILMFVLLHDFGISIYGSWDKANIITHLVFLLIGLIVRNIVHGVGLWLYMNFMNVPLTTNNWSAFTVDMRFDVSQRFYPSDLLITMFVGFCAGIFFFVFFGLALALLLRIFQWLPYFVTRFFLWFGIAVFFDPIISAVSEAAYGNTATGDAYLLMNQISREEGGSMSGWLLTLSAYGSLMIVQLAFLYIYSGSVHLNGRATDVYDRLLFPERSFFCPHDLEISERELQDVCKEAKKYRDEQLGTVKKVRVRDFDHKYTCYFRARLYKLLSIRSDNAEEWVSEYVDSIPLRRPKHSEKHIERNLGSYTLGKDVMNFMRRHFPHLTVMNRYRVGDMHEDTYYEAELLRGLQMKSTPNEDDLEMRNMLKAYFKAQLDGRKPCHWAPTEGNEEESNLRTPFTVSDWQLLADLIFFETSRPAMRSLNLRWYLLTDEMLSDRRFENPEEKDTYALSNFVEGDAIRSTEGKPAQGALIQIFRENPARDTKEINRVFVVTPFGTIIEPNRASFSYMEHHTADDTEFWAQRALETISDADKLILGL